MYVHIHMYRQIDIRVVDYVLNSATKLSQSAIALNTNYMENRLFRCETMVINNFAHLLLSELPNSNLRSKFLNCRGQNSSPKVTSMDSSFYANVRYIH